MIKKLLKKLFGAQERQPASESGAGSAPRKTSAHPAAAKKVIGVVPDHVPLETTSFWPTWAVPLIVGGDVFFGGIAAAAAWCAARATAVGMHTKVAARTTSSGTRKRLRGATPHMSAVSHDG